MLQVTEEQVLAQRSMNVLGTTRCTSLPSELRACCRLQGEAAKMNNGSYRCGRLSWEINLISACPAVTLLGDQMRACSAVQFLTKNAPGATSMTPQPGLLKEQRSLVTNPSLPAPGDLTALATHGGEQTVQPQLEFGASAQGASDKIHPLRASAQENAFASYERYFKSANSIQNETHYSKEKRKSLMFVLHQNE